MTVIATMTNGVAERNKVRCQEGLAVIPARSRPVETAYHRLRRGVESLTQLLSRLLTSQDAEQLKRTFRALHRDVHAYYRWVELQFFVQETASRAPYLRRQLEVWQRKHLTLMQELEQTYKQLRKRRNHLEGARPKLQNLISAILEHEEERDRLAYESFYPEPAALD